ncbi:MAG: hypothetical protein U5K43_04505 [Halofilum sp. (in: g-proteobacteria)]|nr:hypothetical protein [Halofilum sp. (in: g-proteobacteria)]
MSIEIAPDPPHGHAAHDAAPGGGRSPWRPRWLSTPRQPGRRRDPDGRQATLPRRRGPPERVLRARRLGLDGVQHHHARLLGGLRLRHQSPGRESGDSDCGTFIEDRRPGPTGHGSASRCSSYASDNDMYGYADVFGNGPVILGPCRPIAENGLANHEQRLQRAVLRSR